MMIPDELVDLLGPWQISGIRPVSGGDVSRAFRVDTTTGPLFAKCHSAPKPDMFAREAAGLELLRLHSAGLSVPEVLACGQGGIVLQWIDARCPAPDTDAEAAFGQGLAQLHSVTNSSFGTISDSPGGYLGSLEVDLTPTSDWVAFFFERRIRPLARRAVADGVLPDIGLHIVDRLEPRAAELCGPAEPPALLHGDLWAGNRMVDVSGGNWLIDPAAHWGHREYDLAMMRLFGGFSDASFASYAAVFPPADGWSERIAFYQVPPLLVHAILFGGNYGAAAIRALSCYL